MVLQRVYDQSQIVAIVNEICDDRRVLDRLYMVLQRVYDQSQIVAIVNEICDGRMV